MKVKFNRLRSMILLTSLNLLLDDSLGFSVLLETSPKQRAIRIVKTKIKD